MLPTVVKHAVEEL